ncbi:MAG TPA: hypothetical protein VF756_02500 [Thermoanaerobaculia bacterium]
MRRLSFSSMAILFDDGLRTRLRDNLAGFERLAIAGDGGTGAAVALVVLPDARGEANLSFQSPSCCGPTAW